MCTASSAKSRRALCAICSCGIKSPPGDQQLAERSAAVVSNDLAMRSEPIRTESGVVVRCGVVWTMV